jgi:hypothetical protein
MRAGWGGYSRGEGIGLSYYYLCRNIFHSHYTQQKSASVLAADVFGTGIFH